MSYGIEIRNEYGALTYSTSDVTWNQVDFFSIAANGSVTNTYPALAGREFLSFQVLIDPPPLDRKAIAHTITRSGTQVSVSGGSENAFILILMR